jgi:dTDP-4-dehydrorhamnose 3,5-epimerase
VAFDFRSLGIDGLVLAVPRSYPDERGFFMETYKWSEFARNGIELAFVQDNHSRSARGVVRGLHFQRPPRAQAKLVRVVRGAAWDVAVDLRRSSPTCYQWRAVRLDTADHAMLYIPPGFAHGFCALEDDTDLVYKCTEEYDASLEDGIRWDDPRLAIPWPVSNAIVSEKDRRLPLIDGIREVW